MRGVLLLGAAYYAFVTWAHWQDMSGYNLAILSSMSAITCLAYLYLGIRLAARPGISQQRMELVGLTANLLMYANVVLHQTLSFEPLKVLYFALMAVVFSATGITLRTTLGTISLAVATLYVFAVRTDPLLSSQLMLIGVATAFLAFGVARTLRRAVVRQIDARLLADSMASRADQLSRTDPLTGVANRRAVFQHMDGLISERRPFWMGVVDLDSFKSINDLYGHVTGDALLRLVVDRLLNLNVPKLTVGRMGGDEFVLIVEGPLTPARVEAIGNEAIAAVSAPYMLGMLQLAVGATAGFAYVPGSGGSSNEVYERADFALYRAKTRRRGTMVVFDAGEQMAMEEATSIEKALRHANFEDEMHVVFQPQYALERNRIVGVEALARWNSPTIGRVPPNRFIRAAERSGLTQPLSRVLLRKALAEMSGWPEDVSLAFNLSAQDACDRPFVLSLCDIVREHGLRESRIEFEITETAVITDPRAAAALMAEVTAMGFRVALDDFGAGYSSFQYIDELPLHKVKVDRRFVQKVMSSERSREIISAVITLCRRLRLDCVLEGVETEEERRALIPLRPDIVQGYLYGRPMPGADIRSLLTSSEAIEPRVAS